LRSAPSRKGEKVAKARSTALNDVRTQRGVLWRYVTGTFVVRIPVSTGERMRIPEEMTLAIMKWRVAHLSPSNRWVPVLERYIKYSSARLDGIGGDSSNVPPSLTWKPPLPGEGTKGNKGGERQERKLCGKVVEVLFDCHGEFEGFVLDECCERRLVDSRERGVGNLVMRACRENLTVCVRLCERSNRIEGIAIEA
jgi:hypothetical protein